MASEKSIDDLYFGVVLNDNMSRPINLVTANLFALSRVKRNVALWVVMPESEREHHDFAAYCFIDVWGRAEYEMVACPWPCNADDKVEATGVKVDLYNLYVKPNAAILQRMVESVSKSSAMAYLKEQRKRYRR